MNERELAELLRANPELILVDDWNMGRNPQLGGATPKMSEHEFQVEIVRLCNEKARTNPAYGLLYAIPNGGHRHPAVAAKLKAEGVKAGLPDLHLPIARHSRYSLYIELKISPNKQSDEQIKWQRRLRVEGHMCECIWDDVEKVMSLLDWYISK